MTLPRLAHPPRSVGRGGPGGARSPARPTRAQHTQAGRTRSVASCPARRLPSRGTSYAQRGLVPCPAAPPRQAGRTRSVASCPARRLPSARVARAGRGRIPLGLGAGGRSRIAAHPPGAHPPSVCVEASPMYSSVHNPALPPVSLSKCHRHFECETGRGVAGVEGRSLDCSSCHRPRAAPTHAAPSHHQLSTRYRFFTHHPTTDAQVTLALARACVFGGRGGPGGARSPARPTRAQHTQAGRTRSVASCPARRLPSRGTSYAQRGLVPCPAAPPRQAGRTRSVASCPARRLPSARVARAGRGRIPLGLGAGGRSRIAAHPPGAHPPSVCVEASPMYSSVHNPALPPVSLSKCHRHFECETGRGVAGVEGRSLDCSSCHRPRAAPTHAAPSHHQLSTRYRFFIALPCPARPPVHPLRCPRRPPPRLPPPASFS